MPKNREVLMDEEKCSNQNYEIIESCTIGSTELVMGHNPNAPNPYVCWYCKGGSNYFWGYYSNELDAARQKLNERYQSECRMPYNQPAQKQKNAPIRTMKAWRAVRSGVQSLSSVTIPTHPTLMCVGTARAAQIISGVITRMSLMLHGKS